jgi:N-acetylmuramoyl-L-alanine amidase
MRRPGWTIAQLSLLLWVLGGASSSWARELVVVIDPGHGGAQPGAMAADGTAEKHLALQLSKALRSELQQVLGAKVFLTREADTELPLAERVAWANQKRPDLFVSIHANSMPTRKARQVTHGIETYFLSANASGAHAASIADRENAEGPRTPRKASGDTLSFILSDLQRTEAHVDASRLAYLVHQKLVAHTQAQDRGVLQAPFYVLNGLQAPAILVEVGYLSHPRESRKLKDPAYQQKLVKAMAEGIAEFASHVRQRDGHELAQPSPR